MLKRNYTPFLIAIVVLNTTISNAQKFVGISGGYGKGTFLNFAKKLDYDSKYHLKNGVAFSSFYETKNDYDSTSNIRIELQYKFQNADMDINNDAGHFSYYKNLDYSFQLLNLNLIYSFRLFEKKSSEIYFLYGLTLSYNLNTTAKGNGWDFYLQTQIDTNGNPVYVITTRNWEKNESKSKDLSKFNFGLDLGLDFLMPINDRLDFVVGNKYNIFLTNITTLKVGYTSLLTGHLNIGLRYNLLK